MKTKILLLMAKQTLTQALASSEVAKNIAMHWNINNVSFLFQISKKVAYKASQNDQRIKRLAQTLKESALSDNAKISDKFTLIAQIF